MTLYSMIRVDRKTGKQHTVYGAVTMNVIAQFWEAYVTENYDVLIRPYRYPTVNAWDYWE